MVVSMAPIAPVAHASTVTVVNRSFEQTLTKNSSESGDLYPSQQSKRRCSVLESVLADAYSPKGNTRLNISSAR
jgi:hypothetical protein